MFDQLKIHRTRFAELAFVKLTPTCWRLVATASLPRVAVIGPLYRTKAELLADLTGYAAGYGCGNPTPGGNTL